MDPAEGRYIPIAQPGEHEDRRAIQLFRLCPICLVFEIRGAIERPIFTRSGVHPRSVCLNNTGGGTFDDPERRDVSIGSSRKEQDGFVAAVIYGDFIVYGIKKNTLRIKKLSSVPLQLPQRSDVSIGRAGKNINGACQVACYCHLVVYRVYGNAVAPVQPGEISVNRPFRERAALCGAVPCQEPWLAQSVQVPDLVVHSVERDGSAP